MSMYSQYHFTQYNDVIWQQNYFYNLKKFSTLPVATIAYCFSIMHNVTATNSLVL